MYGTHQVKIGSNGYSPARKKDKETKTNTMNIEKLVEKILILEEVITAL